ncbi:hypothetical protein PSPO01_03463 [Paraphaeosphaeria sporulosa]
MSPQTTNPYKLTSSHLPPRRRHPPVSFTLPPPHSTKDTQPSYSSKHPSQPYTSKDSTHSSVSVPHSPPMFRTLGSRVGLLYTPPFQQAKRYGGVTTSTSECETSMTDGGRH